VCVAPVLTDIQFTQQHFLVYVPDTNFNWKFSLVLEMQCVDGQIHVRVVLIWQFFCATNESRRQTPYIFAVWERAWDWKIQ